MDDAVGIIDVADDTSAICPAHFHQLAANIGLRVAGNTRRDLGHRLDTVKDNLERLGDFKTGKPFWFTQATQEIVLEYRYQTPSLTQKEYSTAATNKDKLFDIYFSVNTRKTLRISSDQEPFAFSTSVSSFLKTTISEILYFKSSI